MRCSRRLLITGKPGTGKTTLFKRIVAALESLGCRLGGFAAPEARGADHRRVGFYLVDLMTGSKVWLARIGGPGSIRVGRYTVDAKAAADLGASAIRRSLEEADVIAIDEVGPMELAVPELRSAISEAAKTEKPLLAVVHAKLQSRDPEVYQLLARSAKIVEVTVENRSALARIAPDLAGWLVDDGKCCSSGRQDSPLDPRSLQGSSRV
jgi:nucleoside-triphosphatase